MVGLILLPANLAGLGHGPDWCAGAVVGLSPGPFCC
jgi:hypothetical protein